MCILPVIHLKLAVRFGGSHLIFGVAFYFENKEVIVENLQSHFQLYHSAFYELEKKEKQKDIYIDFSVCYDIYNPKW